MEHEHDRAAAELKAELRRLADAILDLEARGRLLTEAPELLKLLGDARSRVFAWEVRLARTRDSVRPADGETSAVVDEAIQRRQEAEREWMRTWGRQDESDL